MALHTKNGNYIYKPLHNTESALLKVLDDILMTTDVGETIALMLLDLSSAFDFVDHKILLFRLERSIGFTGTVLKWFQFFLSNRRFSVTFGAHSSSATRLTCGVPQGSVLGPLLFSLYMLP